MIQSETGFPFRPASRKSSLLNLLVIDLSGTFTEN